MEKETKTNKTVSNGASILVTGGAGFIGSNLVDRLIEEGYRVAVLDDLSSGKREYIHHNATFYEADVSEEKQVKGIFSQEKFEYVFHLAAQISVKDSVLDPVRDREVNAGGSFNIFRAALDSGVKKVIFISTGGALYGDITEPAKESDPVLPVSPYAIHKFTAERYLELFRTEFGLRSITLRLANVYGPRQFKGGEGAAVAVFTHNAVQGLPSTVFGNGTKTRDYIFVDDVCTACLTAMKSDEQGVFNIGTEKRISVLDLLKTIEHINGTEMAFSHDVDRPGEVQDSILSNEKVQKLLAWKPEVDLEEGIRRTIVWSKSNLN